MFSFKKWIHWFTLTSFQTYKKLFFFCGTQKKIFCEMPQKKEESNDDEKKFGWTTPLKHFFIQLFSYLLKLLSSVKLFQKHLIKEMCKLFYITIKFISFKSTFSMTIKYLVLIVIQLWYRSCGTNKWVIVWLNETKHAH